MSDFDSQKKDKITVVDILGSTWHLHRDFVAAVREGSLMTMGVSEGVEKTKIHYVQIYCFGEPHFPHGSIADLSRITIKCNEAEKKALLEFFHEDGSQTLHIPFEKDDAEQE